MTVDVQQFPISVARTEKATLACEITGMDEGAIMQTFHQLHQWAAAHGLLSGTPEYYGVFLDTPHTTAPAQCRYLAGIRIQGSFTGRESYTIKGMTIARIPVMGGFDVIMDYALFVKQRWMLDSGYALVQGVPGYEHFSGIDFSIPYQQHYRTICVGIQPK
ncbi:GyrI-like domain-containing protein [Chitinophaga agrisoli]|uniref:GyrI-like domain-containing protein n=2 Tax=Chitinophaga agrisoli TaxID=2607653 RepID=A0A5B2VTK4_9BACT|nr:GyrI-like domain-containing protein [Chitinophaga agrisoli]